MRFVYLCTICKIGLHNCVDIKISKIHKKRKIIHFGLNLSAFWCIVFGHTLFLGVLCRMRYVLRYLSPNVLVIHRGGIRVNTRQIKLRLFSEHNFQALVSLLLSVSGFFLGIVLSVYNTSLASGIDTSIFYITPTYAYLLTVNVIPIVVLVCFLAFSLTPFCYLLVLLHSVCHSFIGMLFYLSFGDGAWLIRFLLCFSSYATTVFMWWLLLRNVGSVRANLLQDPCFSLIIICATTVVDFKIIIPFLSSIFVQ